MKKLVTIRTEYGPAEVEVTYCNGPDCHSKGFIEYLPGWYYADKQGIDITTMGQPYFYEREDFCSIECLRRRVN